MCESEGEKRRFSAGKHGSSSKRAGEMTAHDERRSERGREREKRSAVPLSTTNPCTTTLLQLIHNKSSGLFRISTIRWRSERERARDRQECACNRYGQTSGGEESLTRDLSCCSCCCCCSVAGPSTINCCCTAPVDADDRETTAKERLRNLAQHHLHLNTVLSLSLSLSHT